MMSKDEWDRKEWNENLPIMPDGWTRYAIPTELSTRDANPWEVIPDEIYDNYTFSIFEEWRPSSMGGHGLAAIWVGPLEK